MIANRIRLIGDVFNVGINDYLELSENVVVPLNFGISDIRDLTSKTGSFSKSIRVVGTKHNNQVLDHLFDVNAVTLEFDINKKQQCLIEQNGNVVLDNAIMQLIDIEKVSTGMGADEQIIYTITVKDTISELFTSIGNKLLTDLDFTDLNHVYEVANVVSSFTHTKEDGYKYVLPITDNIDYLLTEMKPAIYVWQYMKRIFEMAGYSFEFDELVSTGVDRLMVPYNGGKSTLSADVQNESEVIADDSSSQETTGVLTFNKLDVNVEISDANGYYNPTTSIYTSPFEIATPSQLEYQIEVEYDLILRNNESVSVQTPLQAQLFKGNLEVRNSVTAVNVGSIPLFINSVNAPCTVAGNGFTVIPQSTNFVAGDTLCSSGNQSTVIPCTNIAIGDTLELGSLVDVTSIPNFVKVTDGLPANVELIMDVKYIKIRIVPSGESLEFSFPLVMNDFIPANIKQSDFLKSIFTMFNIFAIPDVDNPKNIILKTRNAFYDGGAVKDFTTKLCKELPHTITLLPELTAKKLTLSYSDDNDPLNVGYKKNVNETYGEVSYNFDNEYIKNEVRKTVIFGSSPFIDSPFGATVYAVNGSEPKTLPRIVYDGGMYPCGLYRIFDTPTQFTTLDEYPFVGHFDKPFNPSIDFNFGICDYYFTNNYGTIPYNNLANTHWRRTMSQINSGKLYTVYLQLNSYDVANLRLDDKIYLDKAYWNINKVIDYDANSNSPTKVELLSVDDEIDLPNFPTRRPTRPSRTDVGVWQPIKEIVHIRDKSLTSDFANGSVISLGTSNVIRSNVKNALIVGNGHVVNKDGVYTDSLFVGGKEILQPTKVYKAILNQSGTSAPTAQVAIDEFGITPARGTTGKYNFTLTSAFDGVVICTATQGGETVGLISIRAIDLDTVEIITKNGLGVNSDGILDDATITVELWQK